MEYASKLLIAIIAIKLSVAVLEWLVLFNSIAVTSLNSESLTYSFRVQLHPHFWLDLVKNKWLNSKGCKPNVSAAQDAAVAPRWRGPGSSRRRLPRQRSAGAAAAA